MGPNTNFDANSKALAAEPQKDHAPTFPPHCTALVHWRLYHFLDCTRQNEARDFAVVLLTTVRLRKQVSFVCRVGRFDDHLAHCLHEKAGEDSVQPFVAILLHSLCEDREDGSE